MRARPAMATSPATPWTRRPQGGRRHGADQAHEVAGVQWRALAEAGDALMPTQPVAGRSGSRDCTNSAESALGLLGHGKERGTWWQAFGGTVAGGTSMSGRLPSSPSARHSPHFDKPRSISAAKHERRALRSTQSSAVQLSCLVDAEERSWSQLVERVSDRCTCLAGPGRDSWPHARFAERTDTCEVI